MNLSGQEQLLQNVQIESDHLSMCTSDDNDQSLDIDHADLSAPEESQDSVSNDLILSKQCLNGDEESLDFSLPLKQILFSINQNVCHRLDMMESRLDSVNYACAALEHKIEVITTAVNTHNSQLVNKEKQKGRTVIVGVPQSTSISSDDEQGANTHRLSTSGSSIQLLTLNSEGDFPNGSWLGDDRNPEMRIRCHISPTDLFHINTTCHTAEKMALTLLDYLFDREIQAISNISGTGKHKKKQLDPLMIYGIRCHLIHKFSITEKDWHRIKQNMDSKCRTAHRRKMKGMPLIVKVNENPHFNDKGDSGLKITSAASIIDLGLDQSSNDTETLVPSHVLALHPAAFSLTGHGDLASMVNNAQVIHTTEGDIRVLHATPEQLAEIQKSHQIQILSGDQVITTDSIIQPVTCSDVVTAIEQHQTGQAIEMPTESTLKIENFE